MTSPRFILKKPWREVTRLPVFSLSSKPSEPRENIGHTKRALLPPRTSHGHIFSQFSFTSRTADWAKAMRRNLGSLWKSGGWNKFAKYFHRATYWVSSSFSLVLWTRPKQSQAFLTSVIVKLYLQTSFCKLFFLSVLVMKFPLTQCTLL